MDVSRRDRLADVKEELWRIKHDDAAQKIPILMYANKQDLNDAVKTEELIQELDL